MCLKDNIEHHWSEIQRKQLTLAEALSWSASGRNLQKMSALFAATDVMRATKNALASDMGNSIDRFKMAQYLALALENNPDHNMQRFIAYLIALNTSKELKFYMAVYEQFNADLSREANLAREIMAEIAQNTSHLIGEYA